MTTYNTFDLIPNNGRKSFYGKAKVTVIGNRAILKSYDTIVCEINTKSGAFKRYWNGWSATTARHIDAFCTTFGKSRGLCKGEWLALPVKQFNFGKFYAPVMANN